MTIPNFVGWTRKHCVSDLKTQVIVRTSLTTDSPDQTEYF
jgi:hypothetical protein